MKIYFSMWAYRDPTRVGYDSVDANYYLEKPFGFSTGGDSQSAYYEAEIPDCSMEEAKAIGEGARQLLLSGYFSNGQQAVDRFLKERKKPETL